MADVEYDRPQQLTINTAMLMNSEIEASLQVRLKIRSLLGNKFI